MKITLIQSDIRWEDPAANRATFAEKIAAAGDTDLIVLPEMFPTGFCTAPEGASEPAGGESLGWMQRMAREKNAAIAGSVATEERGRYFNRFYFVCPDGTYMTYDKRHLFTYAGEDRHYTAGRERTVAEYRGWRILPQVCYDARFPVWSRNRGDYDMILYVASWPASRVDAWNALLRARAIENVCYVAGVNRVGDDPNAHYSGGTVLLDYLGKPIAAAGDEQEAAVSGEVDMEALKAFRAKFPALRDGDPFHLEI